MTKPKLSLKTLHRSPYGWPLRLLKVPQAHRITRGCSDIIVAVIDLGYRYHPDHQGHLWINPQPSRNDIHGWDCHDDDASLEDTYYTPPTAYSQGHHAFIVGEIIACAPHCKIMVVRVGYGNPDSWHQGIDYAVEHGAKILAIPHGYIPPVGKAIMPLFSKGTDFSYPLDNPQLRESLDRAYDAGCLIFKGVADNRGRRVACAEAAFDSVIAVGSANAQGLPADICCSSDYVEIAAPSGQRSSKNPRDYCWSTGGNNDYISFTGGCMACGWAAGVAALVMSQYPTLSNVQIRQILRNTASNAAWDNKLGWGILNAQKALSCVPDKLTQQLSVVRSSTRLTGKTLEIDIKNLGVFDVEKALIVAYNGDPRKAAVPQATPDNPALLVTRQIGHSISAVGGLGQSRVSIKLTEKTTGSMWLQICSLDRHSNHHNVQTVRLTIPEE